MHLYVRLYSTIFRANCVYRNSETYLSHGKYRPLVSVKESGGRGGEEERRRELDCVGEDALPLKRSIRHRRARYSPESRWCECGTYPTYSHAKRRRISPASLSRIFRHVSFKCYYLSTAVNGHSRALKNIKKRHKTAGKSERETVSTFQLVICSIWLQNRAHNSPREYQSYTRRIISIIHL